MTVDKNQLKLRVLERVSPAGLAGVFVGVVLVAGTSGIPEGSAAFPRLIGYAMLGLGGLELLRTVLFGPNQAEREQRQSQRETSAKSPLKPVLLFIAATLTYVVIMPLIGFYATTFVYLVGTMLLLGVRKISLYLIVPMVMIGLLYFGFTTQLRVPLPQGVLI